MPRPHLHHRDTLAPAFVSVGPYTRYLVIRQGEVWLIKFEGEEYGPYNTEREALLFAIDAAHKLAGQGEDTQVLIADESGKPHPAWTHGRDPYPPAL
jgi:hypothetical protein